MSTPLQHDLRTLRFWRHFALQSLASVGVLTTLLELTALFFPAAFVRSPWLFLVVLVLSVAFGAIRAWPRPIQKVFSTPNTKVTLIRGDLFEETGHLVIGACDTFDTASPYIATQSVQGQFLARVFDNNLAQLDSDITDSLQGMSPVGTIQKPGKTAQFDIGTIAVLTSHARKYFLVAYTRMNENNEARGTVDGLWRSLSALWDEVRSRTNGGIVCIPVIGGGQSRLSQILPAQDAIRFIMLSFVLASRHEKVCDELRIVAMPKEYDRLDRLELQSFLSSLSPS